jgi:hypothetical protein
VTRASQRRSVVLPGWRRQRGARWYAEVRAAFKVLAFGKD